LAAAKLIHPNIVTAFDAGEQNGIHYLVMEYVEGGDLKSLIDKNGPLPLNQALQYTMQVARGLQYAHEQQIIHRDIKPANLLIDKFGFIKILDLGLARIVREQNSEEDFSLTSDGAMMGTVDFLSPEQGVDTKSADVRSDIYSLGCTLYTLLAGEAVFPEGTLVSRILAHREKPVPSIRARRNDAPESVDSLIQKMLAKSPDDRPQSMAIVADMLQQILSATPLSDSTSQVNAAVTSDDAFLETLILANDPTVTDSRSRQINETIPQPTPPSTASIPKLMPVPKVAKDRRKKSRLGLTPIVTGLLIAVAIGVLGFTYFSSQPKSLTIAFDPSQLREVTGASIAIDQQPKYAFTDATKNPVQIAVEDGVHILTIEKEGFEPFSHEFKSEDSATLNVVVKMRKRPPTNVPPTPVVPPPMPPQDSDRDQNSKSKSSEGGDEISKTSTTEPPMDPGFENKSGTPDSANPITPDNAAPKTLIVGLGTGEIPDLQTALQQAQPNDTILIRHRGPLEMHPTDLTDKTPLTIRGDSVNGADYWPIIRQAKTSNVTTAGEAPAQSWIHGEKLNLKLVNLHLGVGGHARFQLESVVACKEGSIEFENCTVTASPDELTRFPAGQPFPFLISKGSDTHNVRINFTNTILRGGRLDNLARIDGEANLFIKCSNVLWAGGGGDLLQIGHTTSSVVFECENSTLYNAKSLCGIPSDRLSGRQSKTACEMDLKKTIVNFSANGRGNFVRFAGQDDNRLNCDEWAKYIRIKLDDVLVSQMDFPLPVRDKKSTTKDFLDAFSISAGDMVLIDPNFRVRPTERELHEVDARDFLVDSDSVENRKLPKGFSLEEIGIKQDSLPPTLACLMEDGRNNPSLATTPRGKPRILKVDSKNGPYKTLEAAFVDLNDDDIIEIQDSAIYTPSRNYDLNSGSGVINVENIPHIHLRAAIGQSPTVQLTDSPNVQLGKAFHQPSPDGSVQPLLMLYASCRSIKLDGIHFTTDIRRPNSKHYFLHTSASCLRISNCSFINFANSRHPTMEITFGGMIVIRPLTWEASNDRSDLHGGFLWVENSVFNNGPGLSVDQLSNPPEAPYAFGYAGRADLQSESLNFRNCFFGPHVTVLYSWSGTANQWITFEDCTIIGKPFFMDRVRTVRSIDFSRNFVLTLTNPIPCNPISILDDLNAKGEDNALWMQDSFITPQFRDKGALRLMPGPHLKKSPEFAYQPGLAKDPKKIFSSKPIPEINASTRDKSVTGFRSEKTKL
jgi:serine/threonine protein kinase